MKKFVTMILALALACLVRAEYVRPDVAASAARVFLDMNQTPQLQNPGPLHSASRNGQSSDPDYYIFNNPDGGWVIISADDRISPVLGYSPTGSFTLDDIPQNIDWWLESVSRSVEFARNSNNSVSETVKKEWKSILSGTGNSPLAIEKVLETANWDQISPYNQNCPIVNGEIERADVGCVASSMAIIMRYYKWPGRGKGLIGGYTTETTGTYIPRFSIANHTYDWDDMPLTDAAKRIGWADRQITKVAGLMYDCGVSVMMDYSSLGSSAGNNMLEYVFNRYFSFSDKIVGLSRSLYTLDRWFSIIKNEIDEGRVVYYSGRKNELGHAFVCDGYQQLDSMFHINWGWGGNKNGFYRMNLKIPYSYEFPDEQFALIGIAPDTCDFELTEKRQVAIKILDNTYGISPAGIPDIKIGTSFKFNIGYLEFTSAVPVTKQFKVCLMDQMGETIRQEGWYCSIRFPAFDSYLRNNITQSTRLDVNPELTDCFKLFVKDDTGEWIPVTANRDFFPELEHVSCGITPEPLIVLPDYCSLGQKIELKLSLGNMPVKSVQWRVNGKVYRDATLELGSGKTELRADVQYFDGSSGTILRIVNVE